MTGNPLRVILLVNEINKTAVSAWMGAVRITIIEAGQGVLEDRPWHPGGANRASISALLNESQFILEYFENVSIIFRHRVILQFSLSLLSLSSQAAAPIARAWVYPLREEATHVPNRKDTVFAEAFGFGR